MAKVKLGSMVALASGSVGGATYSRNRYGVYVRGRATPVNPATAYQTEVRAVLQQVSSRWKTLMVAQHEAWASWAQGNPITDVLGDKQVLTGHAAYCQVNSRLWRLGSSYLDVPPMTPAPLPFESLSGTYDIGAGAVSIVYTPTPSGAGICEYVWAAVTESTGIKYVKNLFKLVFYSSSNDPSPLDIKSAVVSRFGTLQVGQKLHISAARASNVTGLVSLPRICSGTIVTT